MRKLGLGRLGRWTAALLLTSVAMAGVASAENNSAVPKWVARATKVGSADESTPAKISVYLKFRNMAALKELVAAQSTPGSASYGKYLTPAQFHTKFAPLASDAAKVRQALTKMGFKVGAEATSHFYIEATGTVGLIKRAFGVTQDLYSFDGKVLRANVEEPKLPAAFAGQVLAIGGLAETGLLIHPRHESAQQDAAKLAASAAVPSSSPLVGPPVAANLPSPFCSTYYGDTTATLSTTPAPFPAVEPWLVCGYTPQQVRAAYGADKLTLDGSGVTVAIVDAYASPTIVYDANHYAANHHLPALTSANFTQIVPYGVNKAQASDPCGPQGWFTEESLDVAAVHTMAPRANIVYVGGLDCGISLNDALYDAIDGGIADIMTNSYGYTGDPLSPGERLVEDSQFIQAASQGITLLFSAGDDADVAPDTGIAEASYPAASPYVVAVGGTSLALTSANGSKSEWGWGTFRAYLNDATVNSATSVTTSGVGDYSFYAGSGGGPALFEIEPAYQKPVVPSYFANSTYDINGNLLALSPNKRVVPDVAMLADPYTGMLLGETYVIAGNPVSDSGCVPWPSVPTYEYCEYAEGGTSLASPLMAGTLAVVEQARHLHHLPDLGLVNPRFYKLTVGAPGSANTPLVDVDAPHAPKAVLRGYANNLNRVRLVTMNSIPFAGCPGGLCQGVDGFSLVTQPGYDNSTGLGTPYLPPLVTALGQN